MVKSDFIACYVESDFHLITDVAEFPLIVRHEGVDRFGYLRLNRKLKRIPPLHPQQFFKVRATFLNRCQHVATVPNERAQKTDDIEKRGFTAGVWSDQSLERPERLINRFKASKSAGLNSCEHRMIMNGRWMIANPPGWHRPS